MEQPNGKNYLVKIRGTNFYLIGYAKPKNNTLIFSDERPEFGKHTFDKAKEIVNGFSQPEKFEIEFITIGHPEIIDDSYNEAFPIFPPVKPPSQIK